MTKKIEDVSRDGISSIFLKANVTTTSQQRKMHLIFLQ